MIMAVSVLPFLIVQLPQLLNSTSGRHLAVLIGLIVSLSLLIAYCLYQVNFTVTLLARGTYVFSEHLNFF